MFYSQCLNKFYATILPTRAVFVLLSFLGISLFYAYKAMLSVALVAMVNASDKVENDNSTDGNECRAIDEQSQNQTTGKSGEFDWTLDEQAIILGGFFYGDIVTQLPAGILAERFGAKWIFGTGVLVAAVMSLLSPLAARTHYMALFATRFGQGLADGVTFPCVTAMMSRWMPKGERSRGTAIIFGVSQIGTIIALPLTGWLCSGDFWGGWPAMFYLLGIAGVVWFVIWGFAIHETPERHPRISSEEFEYIKVNQIGEVGAQKRIVPWKAMLSSIPVYALIITHFGQMWGFLTVLTLLPTYFTKILHFDIAKNGLMSSLPYVLVVIVGFVASYVSDRVRQSGNISVTAIRKINNTIAFIGPAICMIGVTLSGCNATLNIVLFTLAMAINGFGYSGVKSTHLDMTPDFAGTLMAITNTFACLPGFLSPIVAAKFYSSGQTLVNWSYIFYLSAAIYTVSAIIYLLFATAKLQSWGVYVKNNSILPINNNDKKYGTMTPS